MNFEVSHFAMLTAAVALAGMFAIAPAMADAVSDAKAAVAKYAGPQTTWNGPTKAPKPEAGKKIVFLSGDEQNDISISMASTSRRRARSSDGTSRSSTAKAVRLPGSPA